MPEDRWKWSPREVRSLGFLLRVAEASGGYKLRGVRGWAHLDDVRMAIGGALFEVLPLLHRRGLLDHEDARPPGSGAPAWIYRINPAGVLAAHALGETATRPIAPIRAARGAAAMYAPERQRGALLLLRAAYDDAGVRFGERGWVTGRELGARVEIANRERRGLRRMAVDTTDLRWLLGHGLIERRSEPGRARPEILWRANDLGRAAPLLTWRTTRADG